MKLQAHRRCSDRIARAASSQVQGKSDFLNAALVDASFRNRLRPRLSDGVTLRKTNMEPEMGPL